MTRATGVGCAGRFGQLAIGFADVADRQCHEAEDLAVVDLESEIAARDRQVEALAGQPAGVLGSAEMRRDERHAAQPPRREDIGALAPVALDRRHGARLGSGQLAAQDLQARERHEIERVARRPDPTSRG